MTATGAQDSQYSIVSRRRTSAATMSRGGIIVLSLVLAMLAGACKNNVTPEDSVRTAIQAHLAKKGTLTLQAFDIVVQQVTAEGDRGQAQVEYHAKNGPGMMQLTYTLERRGDNWEVVESLPVGADFSHPSLDAAPQSPTAPVAGGPEYPLADALRRFKAGPGVPSSDAAPPNPQ